MRWILCLENMGQKMEDSVSSAVLTKGGTDILQRRFENCNWLSNTIKEWKLGIGRVFEGFG